MIRNSGIGAVLRAHFRTLRAYSAGGLPAHLLDAGRHRIRGMPHVPRHPIIYSSPDNLLRSRPRWPREQRRRRPQPETHARRREPAQRDGVVAGTGHVSRFQRGETGASRFRVADARLFDHQGRHDQLEPTRRLAPPFPRSDLVSKGHHVPRRPRGQIADDRRLDVHLRLHVVTTAALMRPPRRCAYSRRRGHPASMGQLSSRHRRNWSGSSMRSSYAKRYRL